MKTCFKCNGQMADDMIFCQNCGAKLDATDIEDTVVVEAEVEEVDTTQKKKSFLDLMKDKIGNLRHIGSKAVRKFIENKQPLLTLHGHIHETVQNANQYMQYINNTISATAGNDHLTDDVFVLTITVNENINIGRIQL